MKEIFEKIKEINEEGVTVLIVEQHVSGALQLASRAYVLEHGRIVLAGQAEELHHNEKVREAYLGI